MSRRVLVALVLVAVTAGACGSKQDHQATAPHHTSHHSSHHSSKRVSTIARKLVDRGVNVAWSTAADGVPVAVAADQQGEAVIVDHERVGALDPGGRVLWATEFADVVNAVPALTKDRVIVPFTRTNGSGGCVGFDRHTGDIKWRYEAIYTGGVAVTVAGAHVICVMRNGQTAGLSPTWGTPEWEFTFEADIDPSNIEVPAATSIAVDDVNGVFAFVARIGDEWTFSVRSVETGDTRFDLGINLGVGPPTAPALVAPGYFGVVAGTGDVCFVSVKQKEFQRFRIPASEGFDPASAPLGVGRLVIVAGRAGDVTAIDLDEVRVRWTARAVGGIQGSHLIVLGHALLLQTTAGELVAFRVADGSPVELPWKPGQAIGMLFSGGPGAAIAVGQDGDSGWIERWEPKPGS